MPAASKRPLVLAASAFALVGTAAAARLLWWYWPGSYFDGATSGVWTALAWDAAHGELYRPLLGPHGYGGTRYMPLLFLADALLIRAHVDPILAGVLLMHAGVLAAALALFAALRSSGVPARLAVPLAATVWCTVIYQQNCTDLNPDYLAAAFAMTALALIIGAGRHAAVTAAAVAIALAGLTKVTAIAYTLPIGLWLAASGRRGAAIRFALTAAAIFAGALVAVQYVSSGTFADSFLATISGGMGAASILRAIPTFVRETLLDPFIATSVALACWCAIVAARRGRLSIEHAWLAATILVTIVIFSSPGTVGNHLVDVQMASTLVVGIAVQRLDVPSRPVAAVYAVLAVMLAAISWPLPGVPSVVVTLRVHGPRSRAAVRALHAEFLPPGTRYLSTDPIVPVLNGERPLLIDAFNLDRFVREGTPTGRDLERQVRTHAFDVIVLRDSAEFPRNADAGDPGFAAQIQEYWRSQHGALEQLFQSAYEVRAVRKPFVILTAATR